MTKISNEYRKFIYAYISVPYIAMGGMMKKKGYDEEFFENAVRDGILKEIASDDGYRRFVFTELAKEISKNE